MVGDSLPACIYADTYLASLGSIDVGQKRRIELEVHEPQVMRGLLSDAINPPDPRMHERRFGDQMDGDLGQFVGRVIFDDELANDGDGILIKRGVDIVGCRTGDLYQSGNRDFVRSLIEHCPASRSGAGAASILFERHETPTLAGAQSFLLAHTFHVFVGICNPTKANLRSEPNPSNLLTRRGDRSARAVFRFSFAAVAAATSALVRRCRLYGAEG
jgi:hypothetical protein